MLEFHVFCSSNLKRAKTEWTLNNFCTFKEYLDPTADVVLLPLMLG